MPEGELRRVKTYEAVAAIVNDLFGQEIDVENIVVVVVVVICCCSRKSKLYVCVCDASSERWARLGGGEGLNRRLGKGKDGTNSMLMLIPSLARVCIHVPFVKATATKRTSESASGWTGQGRILFRLWAESCRNRYHPAPAC